MTAGRVVAYVPDLMDRSKVRAAAAANGLAVEFSPSASALIDAVAAGPAGLVLVDLSRPGALDILTAVAGTVPVLAFGSHVDRELLASGRATGAEVLARSELFRRLPDLLAAI